MAWWTLWFGLAALLATWHGGAVPARCFRASSTRERVTGASVVLFVLLLIEVLPEVGLSRMSGWETLPSEHGAHVIGDVGDWPRAVDAARTRAGVPLSARLVLAQSYEEPGTGPRALCDQLDAAQVIVRVRQTPRAGDVARVLDCLVFQHGSGISSLPTRQHFAVDGVGLWAADPTGELIDLRAAVALREGLTRSLLADWTSLRQQLGPDLAAAVGAVGLRVLDDEEREPWLRDVVLRRVPWSTLALFGVGEAPDIASLTPEEHLERWWRALATMRGDGRAARRTVERARDARRREHQ